jgi:hypothetical protein
MQYSRMNLLVKIISLAALMAVCGCARSEGPLQFDETKAAGQAIIFHWSDAERPYLSTLRKEYKLEEVVAGTTNDFGKVRALTKWAHDRWEHDGSNVPKKSDPLSILAEAKLGKGFRCVEYAIVLSAALNAVDVPARVVALKMKDVETRQSDAGHVVTEAYLRDAGKWIMADGQWDAVPLLNGVPVNAVELQRALAERNAPMVAGFSKARGKRYFRWIRPYLFYFDVALDNRYAVKPRPERLMLVPAEAKEPTVFQRTSPIKNMVYTRSLREFYAAPDGNRVIGNQ